MQPGPSGTLTADLSVTRRALAEWASRPWPVVLRWLAGSAVAAALLLLGTLVVAESVTPSRVISLAVPPVAAGDLGYVFVILGHNLLVLALHVLACVAGFIAGSRLPREAERLSGLHRAAYVHLARAAILFVIVATAFSLGYEVWELGTAAAGVAFELHTSTALLLLALLPHAAPELLALFLPLAAWASAARGQRWDELLAAAGVTTAIAVPILIVAASWETYGAPQLVALVAGH